MATRSLPRGRDESERPKIAHATIAVDGQRDVAESRSVSSANPEMFSSGGSLRAYVDYMRLSVKR